MDSEMEEAVQAKVKAAMTESQTELLQNIGQMISQISEKQSLSNDLQLTKLTSIISSSDIPKFKRKSNEEQYKQNAKVICKLDEAQESYDALNVDRGKDKIAEGI